MACARRSTPYVKAESTSPPSRNPPVSSMLTNPPAHATTVRAAARKALAEAYAVRAWGRELLVGCIDPPPADKIVSFRDHIAFYTRRPQADAASFLTASSASRPIDDVAPLPGRSPLRQVEEIAGRLAKQDVSAYAVDTTTCDLAAAGLAVAKVVAPELCQLDVLHGARFVGGFRWRTLPAQLGLRRDALRWEDLNPAPHPFP